MVEGLRRRSHQPAGDNARDPIAIVGVGCRFPGAVASPEALWKALLGRLDAIGPIPGDRFDAEALYQPYPPAPGRIGTRWGGFLDGIDRFDADFFRIAPREADRLDPQQRLLLEVAWEALEDGLVSADRLMGTRTGVFVGVWLNDFEARLFADPAVDFYMTTGSGRYSASGRISYALGLQGPSITVDTACSSSLVAVHLACQSLWAGESETALAAGANVILQPHITIAYSQSSMMAPDGRCKFGDARADGYVRSEGAAAVLLKPLSRALDDGDPVYAVIRGSAVNNDGKSGEYMATPAQAGQEQMLRLAYEHAGVEPTRVVYVEAHGTGTAAGDPVELGAIGAVLGDGRPADRPLWVGSIKTNVGHTEGAAGVAGLIKAALALRHGVVPPSLHHDTPNPNIPWDAMRLRVPTEPSPIATEDGALPVAGVSSFGIAGTNAHVVLEAAPEGARWPEANGAAAAAAPARNGAVPPSGPVLVPLSARSGPALAELAGAWVRTLGDDAPPLADLAHSAGCRRAHLEERAAVVAADHAELKERLEALAAGEAAPGVLSARTRGERLQGASGARPKVVFVFPGQGSQWQGMAQELLTTEPVFRETIALCERAMRPFVDWSLTAQLEASGDEAAATLQRIDVVQPVLVAVDVALAELWRSWGVEPDAVVGHSVGEVAAAHVAGALSLDDAMRVVCLRSKLMRRTSGQGAMAAVELSVEEAEARVAGSGGLVSVAASNSPRSTILSGDPEAIDTIVAELEAGGVFARRVNVDVASHSAQMEPLVEELRAGLQGMRPGPATVPILSTVDGGPVQGETLDAAYWTRNLRQPVRFSPVIGQLLEDGYGAFVEASPHPVLLPAIEQTARAAGREASVIASLRRQEPERATLLGSLGALWVQGYPVDFARLGRPGARAVRLPRYPWQRERFWYEPPAGQRAPLGAGAHPLLGAPVRSATGAVVWEGEIGTERIPFLADHRVRGKAVLPATGYLEMMIAAASEALGGEAVTLRDVVFEAALFLDQGPVSVQVVVEPDAGGSALVRVFGRTAAADGEGEAAGWTLHARGAAVIGGGGQAAQGGAAPEGADSARDALAPDAHYEQMAARGLEYGESFRALADLRVGDHGADAALAPPERVASELGSYRLHPALLDAAFQLLLQTANGTGGPEDTYLPSELGAFDVRRPARAGEALRARAVRRGGAADPLAGDVDLLDALGEVVASARGLRFHRLVAGGDPGEWTYRTRWVKVGRVERKDVPAGDGAWLVVADREDASDPGPVAERLGERLAALGRRPVVVHAEAEDDLVARLREAASGGPVEGVAYLRGLGASDEEPAVGLLRLVKAVAAAGLQAPPRIAVVTRGARAVVDGAAPHPPQATLWGMAGVLANEHPELRPLSVDLDPAEGGDDLDALARELCAGGREERVAFRGGERWAARLVRAESTGSEVAAGGKAPAAKSGRAAALPATPEAYRIVTTAPGLLDRLVPRATRRRAPAAGQVEIEVRATGLNFMNVMSALGIYPGYPNGVGPLGIECAGTVARVGDGVEGFSPGDRVVAYAFDSLATHALADRALVAPMPARLGFTEAATIPIAYLTAWYALVHLARLGEGERVLIHSATGGVGLAALHLARRAGAEVFATAGSEEKRAHLRSLGVRHVYDSRSLAFADQVLEATGGEGVDVVLNSLAGPAIREGLRILRPYGRFVEIGKKDIYDDARVGLSPFRNNLSYFAVDLERMARGRPAPLGRMLRGVVALVDAGELEPLPLRTFPASEVGEAFRHMAQARHVGKVVVEVQPPAELAGRMLPPESAVRPDATYLITGGAGGLGLAVAARLVEEGARHLLLVGRSGVGQSAAPALAALEEAGAQVVVARADVSDRSALGDVLDRARREMPPLRGVVHAAGLLSDGTFLGTDEARFRRAFPPKVQGALALDALTRGDDLDFFVLFSSVAALLGTAGQSNYAAANAFMDALAHARRARGLPATAVQWGPWSEVGLAAASDDRGGRLAQQGLASLTPEQGVAAFSRLIATDPGAEVAVMRFDVGRWCASQPAASASPFFASLKEAEPAEEAAASAGGGIRDTLAKAEGAERRRAVERYLQERVAQVLRLATGRVALDRPLKTMGMDSLMTLELRNRLEAELGLTLSATAVWNYPTVELLSGHLLEKLDGGAAPKEHASAPSKERAASRTKAARPADPPADVDDLSREELEAALASELAGLDDILGED